MILSKFSKRFAKFGKKEIITFTILISLFLFLVVNNIIIFEKDGLMLTRHESYSYTKAHVVYETGDVYPVIHSIIYPYITVALFNIFGKSLGIALFTNYLLLALFIIYNYKLGKLLFNTKIAILSTFFATTVPLFFAMSRFYDYKFAGISILPLTIYYMLRTQGFTSIRNTVIFTATVLLSFFFLRPPIINFIAPLLVFYLFWNRKKIRKNIKKIFTMFLGFLIGSYVTISLQFKDKTIESTFETTTEGGIEFTLGGLNFLYIKLFEFLYQFLPIYIYIYSVSVSPTSFSN